MIKNWQAAFSRVRSCLDALWPHASRGRGSGAGGVGAAGLLRARVLR